MKTFYIKPKDDVKSKDGRATLTIDFFKKNFRLPLNTLWFESISFEEDIDYIIPLKTIIHIDMMYIGIIQEHLKIQGIVEGVIIDKRFDGEFQYVLINPFKK